MIGHVAAGCCSVTRFYTIGLSLLNMAPLLHWVLGGRELPVLLLKITAIADDAQLSVFTACIMFLNFP